MTIGRTVRTAVLVALVSVAVAVLGHELFYMHWLRAVVSSGHSRLLDTTAETLDHEIRAALPPGSSLPVVVSLLQARRIDYDYDGGPREVKAWARHLKGSTPLVEAYLALQFHFNDDAMLQSIDSSVVHTRR